MLFRTSAVVILTAYFSSCSLLTPPRETRIKTSYKIISLIKEKKYEELKKYMGKYVIEDQEGFKRNVDLGSEFINRYGVPNENKIEIKQERGGEFTVITFPLHQRTDPKDTIIEADIVLSYMNSGNPRTAIYFQTELQPALKEIPQY